MSATTALEQAIHAINVCKEVDIAAPLDIAFEALLEEMGPESQMPSGAPFPMVLEPWPGGRWYRDLGNGAGHLWGHVQVIKPPTLLEIYGPLFMSYAAASHLQYRLTAVGDGARLKITHSAIGQIPAEHREGVNQGWEFRIGRVREVAERLASRRSQ